VRFKAGLTVYSNARVFKSTFLNNINNTNNNNNDNDNNDNNNNNKIFDFNWTIHHHKFLKSDHEWMNDRY
jgi:hypothetical protein